MGIFDLFSKRQKRLRGEVTDVYVYDHIPKQLRVQVVHIWHDVLGTDEDYYRLARGTRVSYDFINQVLCREYGVFYLSVDGSDKYRDLIEFILENSDQEKILDAIEVSFRLIDKVARQFDFRFDQQHSEKADNAINEINARFKEHGVGYEFRYSCRLRVHSFGGCQTSVKTSFGKNL